MRKPRDDAGSTHVLEAVIIATIMVSSVVYVATFDSPPGPGTDTRAALRQRSADALGILADTPVPGSSFGDNMLSAYVAECMQGNCTDLRNEMKTLLPAGTSYSISLSNGYDTWPVYGGTPPGEAVTTSHLMEPKWSYTFLGTGQSLVNPSRDPLYAYAVPVFDSNVLDQGGSPLRVIMHGTSGGANFTLSAEAATEARTATQAVTPAASLYFVDPYTGLPTGALDLSNRTVSGTPSAPTHANVQLRLRLEESANQPIPAGAQVDLSLPRGWNATASGPLNAGWNLVAWAANATGGEDDAHVTARLNASLANASKDLVFNVTYQGDLVSDYVFHAAASRGTLAVANLAVRGDTSTTSTFTTPEFVASVPRPMGSNATTTWTLGLTLPSVASNPVSVNSIEIIEQDGRQIFGSSPAIVSGDGTIVSQGDRLVWTPSMVTYPTVLSLAFHATPSGTASSPDDPRAEFQPPMTVGNFTGRWLESAGTGLWRQAVLPNTSSYGGYETGTGLSLETNHSFSSDGVYRGLGLPGSANYTLSNVTAVGGQPYGSYIGVERREVPVGGTAVVDIDVQSLLFTLSSAKQTAGVTLHVYPPWSGDQRTPIQTNTSFDTELLTSDVVSMTLLDVNGDGYADPILGTSNGRVLALHALTGGRIEADVFSAPFGSGSSGSTAASIAQLGLATIAGQTYIVAATDQGSVFLLDHSLHLVWQWYWSSTPSAVTASVVSMDTGADVDGDGRNDVVIGLQLKDQQGSSAGNVVFVLRATGTGGTLAQWPADSAFYTPVGTPNAVLGLSRIGPAGTVPGVAMTFQYTPGLAGVTGQTLNPTGPAGATATISLPKAGMHGVSNDSSDAWTFSGPPITVAHTYDYDGDPIPDIVGGAPAGYVFMMNGSEPTAPIVSTSLTSPPATEVVASTTHDGLHSAFLTRDHSIYYTTDGWLSQHNVCDPATQVCLAPAAASLLAMNASTSFWAAGSAGSMWRTTPATDSSSASSLSLVAVTPNATKDGSPYDLSATGTLYDFKGLQFGWGDAGNSGWAMGTRTVCGSTCEDLVMRTTNGGWSWTVASNASGTLKDRNGNMVTASLSQLNFTNNTLGWIVGNNGTLLRTKDAGATWTGLSVNGTSYNLSAISCAPLQPDTCIVVGEKGSAWRTTNATATTPGWTPIDLGSAVSGKTVSSVGLVNATVGYAGASNVILKTWDGGDHWSVLPLSYVPANGDIVNAMADGTGYVYGGTAANQRTFYLGAYNLSSHAQTTNVASGVLDPGTQVLRVDMEASDSQDYPTPPSTSQAVVRFNVTTNGHDWYALVANGSSYVADPLTGLTATYYPKASSHSEWGSEVYDYVEGWTTEIPSGARGNDVRVRMDFATSGDFAAFTASVHALKLNMTYWDGSAYQMRSVTLDLNSTQYKDAANTDAVWINGGTAVHQPLVQPYWVRNVSGAVQDVLVGKNVSGDSRAEVYVATGNILAENSPDSIPYAGNNPSLSTGGDDRVYLLDGKNGTIVAQTSSFAGPITHLALSDVNGDGVPEYLYATVWDGHTSAQLVCLDPATLAVRWTQTLGSSTPTALASGALTGPNATAFVTVRTGADGPGHAMAYRGWDGYSAWSAVPDQQGHYTVNIPVQKNWLFGPYVVEAAVDWNTTAYQVGNATPQTLVQTEKFYDYFLVTPPDALAPPSPIYNVQLTTWYDDWR